MSLNEEEKTGSVDVEKIMEQIRDEIEVSGARDIPLSFEDKGAAGPAATVTDGSKLGDAVEYLSYNYEVQPYQLLTGNPVKVFIKKAIRKIAGFFFLPIVGQQNTLNFNFFLVSEAVREQRDEIEELKKVLSDMENRVKSLEGEKS